MSSVSGRNSATEVNLTGRIRILDTLGHKLGEDTLSHALANCKVLGVEVSPEEDAAAARIAASMGVVIRHRVVETTMVTAGEGVSLLSIP